MDDQSSPDLGAAESADPVPRVALMLEQDVSRHVAAGKTLDFRGLLAFAWDRLKSEVVNYLDAEPLADMAEKLYDKHVAPIDLPGIPNLIEPRFDAMIRAQIRPLIYRSLDAVKQ